MSGFTLLYLISTQGSSHRVGCGCSRDLGGGAVRTEAVGDAVPRRLRLLKNVLGRYHLRQVAFACRIGQCTRGCLPLR